MIYTTAADAYATTALTPFARTLLDDPDAVGARATLGLVIGTNVQAQNAALASIAGLMTSANQMIYTTAADAYATTALTPFARTLLDDATAGAVFSTLGVSDFMQSVLDDGDAATARATLGVNSASNLNAGTLPNARLTGAYDGITTLGTSGRITVSNAGECLRLDSPLATDDPYITWYAGGARQAYIQHLDGTGTGAGFKIFNDVTDDYLYLSNVNNVNALKFYDSSVNVHADVYHSNNNRVIGEGQTWQSVTRSSGTSYQNTTGRPIMVAMIVRKSGTSGTATVEVSSDNSTWTQVGNGNNEAASGGTAMNVSFIVPVGWYYRATSATSVYVVAELK